MRSPSKPLLCLPFAAAVVLALGTVSPAAAQTTIGAGGGSLIQSWGKNNTQTYGQTFTTPADYLLTDFSFWLGRTSTNFPDPSNPSLDFMAYVYGWDGALNHAVGSALYTSALFTHDATPATPFTQYTFTTGGVSLTPGSTYVLFLSTSGLTGTGRIQWEAATGDEYAGGNFVYQNNGESTSDWTNAEWSGLSSDLHFEANFASATENVVPEPATMTLLATGLVGMFGAGMKRRHKKA